MFRSTLLRPMLPFSGIKLKTHDYLVTLGLRRRNCCDYYVGLSSIVLLHRNSEMNFK